MSNFKYADRARIINTASSELDNLIGTIVGVSIPGSAAFPSIYIIEMDSFPTERWPWKCITLTGACLEKIDA